MYLSWVKLCPPLPRPWLSLFQGTVQLGVLHPTVMQTRSFILLMLVS